MFGGFTLIWLIGDLHLGHQRIIDYTGRPFSSVEEMDTAIIQNWNKYVRKDDWVICLGDFAFGDPRPYLRQLNGRLILIKGNHDKYLEGHYWLVLGDFLLIHRPQRPFWWDGWIIHCHIHNNGPFINEKKKLINVAVENTGYRPVPFSFLKALF
jgi:calcineurin-like phosphoesterase family protein